MDYAMASTSMAHTYGNVTSFITEFVKQLFPKNFFKTVHVSSTIAYRQFNIFQNSNQEFLKKNKPMLIIRPRIEVSENDNFLFGTYLTQRITDNYMDLDYSNLQDFIQDESKGINVKFLLNRLKMYFDISVITESNMEQINQYVNLKNRIRQEHNIFIPTALESYIPKELFDLVSKDIGIPMYDDNNSVKPFLDYINQKSMYPVTYKLKNSSGVDEFFRYYPINLDTLFSGLTIDDGNKKGFIFDTFSINWTISTEFNAAGLYYYFTENKDTITDYDISISTDNGKIIPIFTVSNIYNNPLPPGWNLYSSTMYKVEYDDKPDITPIKGLFNESLLKTIDYHKTNGIPLNVFMNIVVMKDNVQLTDGVDYSIDYETFNLTTNKVNTVSTYRILMNVNTLYINNLIKQVYDLNAER